MLRFEPDAGPHGPKPLFHRLAAACAAVALATLVLPTGATASLPTGPVLDASHLDAAPSSAIQLAGKKAVDPRHTPLRGSSAELSGGSSADRYGGSSADRRGVAGRHDVRNRGIRQFTAQNKKRDNHDNEKHDDELDDQDNDGPREMFQFAPPDPGATFDRSKRD